MINGSRKLNLISSAAYPLGAPGRWDVRSKKKPLILETKSVRPSCLHLFWTNTWSNSIFPGPTAMLLLQSSQWTNSVSYLYYLAKYIPIYLIDPHSLVLWYKTMLLWSTLSPFVLPSLQPPHTKNTWPSHRRNLGGE